MKFTHILLATVCLLPFSLYAENDNENALLWEISGNGLTAPSYLFGTYHGTYGIGADFLDSIPKLYDAFNSVSQYIGEIDDISEENNLEMQKYLQDWLGERLLPEDISYKDLLSEKDYEYLDSIARVNGRMFLQQVKISPNYLFRALFQARIKDHLQSIFNVPDKEVIDFHLLKSATQKGYTTKGLDTGEMAVKGIQSLFSGCIFPKSLQESADFIISSLKEIDDVLPALFNSEYMEYVKQLENAYKKQNAKDLVKYKRKLMEYGEESTQKQEEETNKNDPMLFLLGERNTLWMKKISGYIAEQPSFIGVGAMHLYGKHGLIRLLREKGYTVNPVR